MSEIDLNKVSGAEWDKYAKMSSIARNGKAVSIINIAMTAIGLILFLYFAFLAFGDFPALHSMSLSLNYTSAAVKAMALNLYIFDIAVVLGAGVVLFLLFDYLGEVLCKKDYRFRSLHSVRNALGYNERMRQRLQQYGYTKDEIRWYFDLHRKLAEFKAFINGSGL